MPTPTSRFQVANLDQWGRLIKSWATHLDYIDESFPDQPPRNYWVNTSYNDPTQPAPKTTTDQTAAGAPDAWCLPRMTAVTIPRQDHTTVTLPAAVALTAQEFTTLVAAAQVQIQTMPIQYKYVIIVQGGPDTMVLRLPPADTLQGSEDDLLHGANYRLPSFYDALYGKAPTMPNCPTPGDAADRATVMTLHANRIGEYTLNNCS